MDSERRDRPGSDQGAVSKAVSGVDRDYAPVVADLAEGWTLCARDDLAANPALCG